jgi:hypothetical protein
MVHGSVMVRAHSNEEQGTMNDEQRTMNNER